MPPVKIHACLIALSIAAAGALADAAPGPSSREARRADAVVAAFRQRVPERYFAEAYGYAVLPNVKRVGYGVGAAWGRGIVFESGTPTGRAGYWQFTSGIQFGARTTSMIVFFRDEAAMLDYQRNRAQFMGQAGLALGSRGLAKTPAYNSSVAIFTLNRLGLMAEASIAIGRLTFEPP
jgi:lipid-binding SYLF domain-containing protein